MEPRVGGEKVAQLTGTHEQQGSPPRGRGKGFQISRISSRFRITPAWAGKSVEQKSTPFLFRDHPRVGGEKGHRCDIKRRALGSPPRGRGKDFSAQHPERGRGITPAWAGKSHAAPGPAVLIGDHPRVGGEKLLMLPVYVVPVGSPPRGRGKAAEHRAAHGPEGITPAWAGKSGHCHRGTGGDLGITPAWAGKRFTMPEKYVASWDHPRVGGEKK